METLISHFIRAQKSFQVDNKHITLYIVQLFFFTYQAISSPIIFSKKSVDDNSVPMIRLKMNGLMNSLDETVVYYQTGATNGFDSEYDAYKLFGPNPAPHISQDVDSLLFSINGIEPVIQTFSVNILVTTPITGNFTITATDFESLPIGTCVYLQDLVLGTSVNILTTPYVFNLSNTTTTSRFILHITHYELPIITEIIQPTCQSQNAGKFKISANAYAPWNYIWKDSTGTIVKNIINSSASDSLDNLSEGNYTVEISSVSNNCYSKNISFLVNKINLPILSYISADTITASISQNYTVINQSSNCVSYFWDFGDGNGISTDFEPTYSYTASGLYNVTLIGTSTSGCIDSSSKYINVLDITTSIQHITQQNIEVYNLEPNLYIIKLNDNLINDLEINLYNIAGQKNLTEHKTDLYKTDSIPLNLTNLSSGIYILNINSKNRTLKSLKVIIQ